MKKYILTICSLLLLTLSVKALEIDPALLPSYIGATNSGTEFYLTFHPSFEVKSGEKMLRIFVTSMYETNVTMEISALNIKQVIRTKPYETICFLVKATDGQPYSKKDSEPPQPETIWKGRAIKITAVDPVICYALTWHNATTDGYMALPVSVLGNEYQVSTYKDDSNNYTEWKPSYTSIVGVFDSTNVTFKMGGCKSCYALKENGEFLLTDEIMKRTLNKGDVWLIPGIEEYNDLSGSTVIADKPVAVISGNYCASIPSDIGTCAYTIEQEIPTYTWGKRYFVSPVYSREKNSIVNTYAKEFNTRVSNDGEPSFTIQHSGGVIEKGFNSKRAVGTNQDIYKFSPVSFSSSKPINVIQYNTSSEDDKADSAPFQMQLMAEEQFQNEMFFQIPTIESDTGEIVNVINLVYKSNISSIIADDLMWGEVIDGKFNWKSMSIYSSNTGKNFPEIEPDSKMYYSKTMKLAPNGIYGIKANFPFGVNILGPAKNNSYGLPAGGRFKDLTSEDSAKPEIDFVMNDDGSISGSVKDIYQDDSHKPCGLSVITLITALSDNFRLVHDEFIPGTDSTINFKLEITKKYNHGKAYLALSDRRGNDTVLAFEVTPDLIPEITGSIKDFGQLKSSQSSELDFILSNSGEKKTVRLKSIIFENNDNQYEIINNISENTILESTDSLNFKVKFTANAINSGDITDIEGIFPNRIGIELMNGDKIFFDNISAEVTNPHLEITDKNFLAQNIDIPFEEQSVYIYNEGKTDLLVTAFEFDAGSPFKFTLPEVSLDKPLIVKSKDQYIIKVRFEPVEAGEFSTELKVISDGYVIKDISKISGIALPVTSVENQNENSDLKVKYENGSLIISSVKNINFSLIQLFDINGKILMDSQIDFSGNNYNIKLPELLSGIYLVKINANGKLLDYKIAVIK